MRDSVDLFLVCSCYSEAEEIVTNAPYRRVTLYTCSVYRYIFIPIIFLLRSYFYSDNKNINSFNKNIHSFNKNIHSLNKNIHSFNKNIHSFNKNIHYLNKNITEMQRCYS